MPPLLGGSSRAKFAEPLDPLWRDGDWRTDPWFLKDPLGLKARHGHYDHARLVELADILANPFPPQVCRSLLQRRDGGGGHVAGLFFAMWGHLVPLLEIAELIDTAKLVPDRLIRRLAIPEHVVPAQLELELLAAVRHAGLSADHEPLGDAGPDLRVCWDYREYFVEAKLLERSEAAAKTRGIEDELARMLTDRVSERAISIRLDTGDGEPLALDRRGRAAIERVAAVAQAACNAIADGDERERVVDIDQIGRLHIERPSGNWVSVQLFEDNNDEHDSERAMRAIRHAAEQMPARGRRIVLVEMSRRADVDDAARLFRARAATRAPHYSNVDLVVFRRGDTGTGRAVAVPGEQLTLADRELIPVLCTPMPTQRPRAASAFLL